MTSLLSIFSSVLVEGWMDVMKRKTIGFGDLCLYSLMVSGAGIKPFGRWIQPSSKTIINIYDLNNQYS